MRVYSHHQGEKIRFQKKDEKLLGMFTMSHFDHGTNQCELEVQRIIHLQNLANQLLDAFIGIKKVTKSHIQLENPLTQIDVSKGKLAN